MSKFLKGITLFAVLLITSASFLSAAYAGDIKAGKKSFKRCMACHAVGEKATSKVGPQLNNLFGRTAGSLPKFRYSKAMKKAGSDGLVWDEANLDLFLIKPKAFVKKNKMTFSGLKKAKDRANIIAYLKTFDEDFAEEATEDKTKPASVTTLSAKQPKAEKMAIPTHGTFHLGRKALPEEIAAWDIDIRPDGLGLPKGRGTVSNGEAIYAEVCAICHGDFGEGIDRWPVLAGGHDTLLEERPEKTIGSYWPYLSTVYDYVRRAMPFGNARSLSDDDVYALTAYLMYLNDIVEDETFELSHENFADIKLPNEANFIADNRLSERHYSAKDKPCMNNCEPEPAKVSSRARVLDVTPEDNASNF